MKYGFSRSLNCSSETDRWSSAVMAFMTGFVCAGACPNDNVALAKRKTNVNRAAAYFMDAPQSKRLVARGLADGLKISLSSEPRSESSECSEIRRTRERTPIRRRKIR